MKLCVFLYFTAIFACIETIRGAKIEQRKQEWWRNAAIYQIYPLSFLDSNNDGRGDLKGIIEKIPYLKETGFNAVWLSPIYKSPMLDFGYDISDFRDIHEWFGTMEDFDNLVREIHNSGMKLIMDFVPNHSSHKHEWFEKSARREPGYEDYYVWKDAKNFSDDGRPYPPNNWVSVFYGPAWSFHPDRKQYYLHQFAAAQPDLNYRNPKVIEEMSDIIRFWVKKGVDGFRIDAVPFLFEDPDFRDEPVAPNGGTDPMKHSYLDHKYTQNLEETFELVRVFRAVIDKANEEDGGDRCLMLEVYASIEDTMKYFGTKERPVGHFPFNFQLLNTNKFSTAKDVKKSIDTWLDNLPEFGHSNWVVGNHDQHRIGSKIREELIDGMNMLCLMLPGTSVTYYGEEIGMLNNHDITYEEGVDWQGCMSPPGEFANTTRDFERTPFQWDGSVNAGFNKGAKPWLPINKNYQKLNLEAQKCDSYSHYTVFTDLTRARQMPAIRDGTNILIRVVGKGTLGFIRGVNSDHFFVTLINFSHDLDNIDLRKEFFIGQKQLQVYTTDARSGFKKGEMVDVDKIKLPGGSALVLNVIPV